MARHKSQPLVKPLRIDAGVVRQQLDQSATAGTRFCDRPLHHLLADATAAAMRSDANVFDQAARDTLRAQSRQDAELQTTDHNPLAVFRNHELDIRVAIDRLERQEIRFRQGIFEALAAAAERIVRQHPHDRQNVVATGAPDGNREISAMVVPVSQHAGGKPKNVSASPIQRRTAA
jgi:hypothetical protein